MIVQPLDDWDGESPLVRQITIGPTMGAIRGDQIPPEAAGGYIMALSHANVHPPSDQNEHGDGYQTPPGLNPKWGNPSAGPVPADFANITFTAMGGSLDKSVSAADDWAQLNTKSRERSGAPRGRATRIWGKLRSGWLKAVKIHQNT